MPLYDFKCANCDLTFELLLSAKESEELQTCPKCENPIKKELSLISKQSHDWSRWQR